MKDKKFLDKLFLLFLEKKFMRQTTLSEVGKQGVIDSIKKIVTFQHSSTVLGIGDDAAVISPRQQSQTVVSSDFLVEGVHFDLIYTPMQHLGYKAVVVAIADVFAMNARPTHITINIAVSAKFTLEAIEQFYEGVHKASLVYNVEVVGGDISPSLTGLVISVTAIGEALPKKITYRHSAKSTDLLCVSGDLGAAYLGLQILEREKNVFTQAGAQPKLEGYEYVLQKFLKPELSINVLQKLDELGVVPTSMIDITSGLSADALTMCNSSALGCRIYEERLPCNEATQQVAQEFSLEPLVSMLYGGGDYEFLFTIDIHEYEKISTIPNLYIIGNMVDAAGGAYLVSKAGDTIPLKSHAWE